MKRAPGRPTTFDPTVVDEILETILGGESARSACRAADVPIGTFLGWVASDRGGLFERYHRTKVIGAMSLIEEIVDIADDGRLDFVDTPHGRRPNHENVRRAQERVATRQWLVDRLMPKQPSTGQIISLEFRDT